MKLDWDVDQIWERIHSECDKDYSGPSHTISGAGASNIYLVKINENGSKVWEKKYGGPYIDSASTIVNS